MEELKQQFADVRDIYSRRKPTLFVEGPSDVVIIKRAFGIFAKEKKNDLHITSGDTEADYGSASAVSSRALAWAVELRHRSAADRTKALALFDSDEAGNLSRKVLNQNIERLSINTKGILSVKSLPSPPEIVALRKVGFAAPSTIESFYNDDFWLFAQQKNWIEELENPGELLTKAAVNAMIKEKTSPFDNLSDLQSLRLLNVFQKDSKMKAALYVNDLAIRMCSRTISTIQPSVEMIIRELEL